VRRVSLEPTIWPRSLIAPAELFLPPSVPRSVVFPACQRKAREPDCPCGLLAAVVERADAGSGPADAGEPPVLPKKCAVGPEADAKDHLAAVVERDPGDRFVSPREDRTNVSVLPEPQPGSGGFPLLVVLRAQAEDLALLVDRECSVGREARRMDAQVAEPPVLP
jgi:hypothetical protein